MNNFNEFSPVLKKQQGMSTILMSTVLIFVVSMISVYAAQISVMEQKISANHYRGKQAFESAQSGLEIALSQLDFKALSALIVDGNAIEHDALAAALPDYNPQGELSNIIGVNNNGLYRLKLARVAGATNNDILVFTSFGYTDDATPNADNSNANHTISMRLLKTKYINYAPPSNLVTLGDVKITGNGVNLTNITGDPMAVVWSAGKATISAATNILVDNGNETDSNNGIYDQNSDLIEIRNIVDSNERKERFFQNFFAQSKSQLKNRATVIKCKNGCTEADLQNLSGIVWVDAYTEATESSDESYATLEIDRAISLGSTTDPIVLIVDGNITIDDQNADITGMIYTSQDFNNGINGKIVGSLISEGDIDIRGDFNITYSKNMFDTELANLAMYTRLPGSWIDI